MRLRVEQLPGVPMGEMNSGLTMNTAHIAREGKLRYASVPDFLQIYDEETDRLYLLSILLTADMEKAEHCFVGAFQECVHGLDVFVDWARPWARRAIIKRAIQLIGPRPDSVDSLPSIPLQWRSGPGTNDIMAAIFAWGAFERFVFVMSILEGQSDEECSTLLGCTRRQIKTSRARSLEKLSNWNQTRDSSEEPLSRLHSHPLVSGGRRN